jgi:hypothetical protein
MGLMTAAGSRRHIPGVRLPAMTAEKSVIGVFRPSAETAGCASTAGKAFWYSTDNFHGAHRRFRVAVQPCEA